MGKDKDWQLVLKHLPPLHRAAWQGQDDRVLAALRKGADVNAQDPSGYSALVGAAAEGHLGTVRLLLEQGANPNLAGSSGNTALMSAASFGHVDVVGLLLEYGADVNATGFAGETALLRAALGGSEDEGILQTARALIQAGADVNIADSRGRTALMRFAWWGHSAVVRLLIERGADVNAKDDHGETALTGAADTGYDDIVALLLEHGADENVLPRRMPLDWNDSAGWESYYASLYPHGAFRDERRDVGSMSPAFVAELKANGWKSVWVPGCGLSPLPKLLAYSGFDVHATDVSPTAIAFQQSDDNDVSSLLQPDDRRSETPGSLLCAVHDFRTPYQESRFDVIFNAKAFQGFPPETMRQVAQVHYRALKPGGHAFVDTINVQGEDRDTLEESLIAAGFVVPFAELNRWYRQKLRETGIPHVFILGHPMIPSAGEYESDKKKWKRDTNTLRAIENEYQRKARKEQEAEEKRRSAEARVALVIYNTG